MIEEILDIVNENDEVIGQIAKSDLYKKGLNNFRVINSFLINNKNEVWIPRRSATKKLFPSCLDASVGGHVSSGESYNQAFERELEEELNIKLSTVKYKLLSKLNPLTHGVSAYMELYVIYTDEFPNYNQDDFVEAKWWNIKEVIHLIENGEPSKGDLPILLKTLNELL